jgi:hypothetical protein
MSVRFSPAWSTVMRWPFASKMREFSGRGGMVGFSWGRRGWGKAQPEAARAAATRQAITRHRARTEEPASLGNAPEVGKALMFLP